MSELRDPRVLFAAERTLMAWNRTSLALIAFGFLVERAGLLMSVLQPERAHTVAMLATFWLGLAFIALGAVAALYSCKQYASVLKTLHSEEFPTGYSPRWGMLINLVVAILGVLLMSTLYFVRG